MSLDRQTDHIRNRNESVKSKDNKESEDNTRTYEFSLFDTGQVGIELPRDLDKAGEYESNGLNNNNLRSTGFVKEHSDQ